MNLGNVLVAKGLVSVEDIRQAVTHQSTNGGPLGDSIVALGLLSKEQIDEVLSNAPQAPSMVQTTGIDPVFLVELTIKGMYTENFETISQLAKALKLSSTIVNQLLQMATERKLVEALAASSGSGLKSEMRYGLTRAGREYAVDALQRGQYFGPAPVSLEHYKERILRQRVTNETVTRQRLDEAFDGLVIPERFVNRLGPAVRRGAQARARQKPAQPRASSPLLSQQSDGPVHHQLVRRRRIPRPQRRRPLPEQLDSRRVS